MEFVELATSDPNHLYVKEEPDDPEIEDTIDNSLADTDPMDLLQLVNEPYYDIDKDVDIDGNDEDTASGSTVNDPRRSNEQPLIGDKWVEWMQEYPWLLHEDTDGCYGYCLYCDQKLCIRSLGHVKGHAASTYHKERGDNYLAFKISEEQANQSSCSIEEIKQEFGTNSRIAAMKFKRMSQIEPLNNFNWRHWLQAHDWLVRNQRDGTTGLCKYCNVNLNVEFSYLRRRHEQSPRHKLVEKSSKEKRDVQSCDQNHDESLHESNEKENDGNEDGGKESENDNAGKPRRNAKKLSKELSGPWFERLANADNMCRCKLCHITMHKYNTYRHLKTHSHRNKFRLYMEKKQKKQELMTSDSSATSAKEKIKVKQEVDWKLYEKKHPWITCDPKDPYYAYCKYCEARIMHGQSPTRRHIHENSIAHKVAVNRMTASELSVEAEEKVSEGEQDEQKEDEKEEDENDKSEEEEDHANEGEQEETETEKKVKRILRGSDVWFELNPWLQKYPKNSNYAYCSYCDVLLLVTNLNVRKHENTERHRTGEREAVKKTTFTKVATNNGSRVSNKGKIPLPYSWMAYSKDNSNMVYCKYCRIRFLSCSCRKHNLSGRHKEAAKVYLARRHKKSTKNKLSTVNSLCPQSIQAKVAMWKGKFPWLTYKRSEMRTNYGYCKPCEQSIFIPTYKFLSKHQRSQKHVRIQRSLQHKNESKKGENNDLEERQTTSVDNLNKSISEENQSAKLEGSQNVYQWMLPDKDGVPNYVTCKYCELRVMIKGILKKTHEKSAKHQAAAKLYWEKAKNNVEESSQNTAGDEDFISSEDSNTGNAANDTQSLKSDTTIDEGGVLQYLLQSSLKLLKRTNLKLNSSKEISNELPESKRPKLSQDVTTSNIIKQISSAQTEIMRLSRTLGDKNVHKNINKKPSSPLSLAADLLPLIQQQQSSSIPEAATPPPQDAAHVGSPPSSLQHRNTFDSFFESVSDTMKNLPPDLAAEGKFKIMQVVYDLEIRALRSKEQQQQPTSSDTVNTIEITATRSESVSQSNNSASVADKAATTTNGYESEIRKTSPAATENRNFSNSSMKSSVRIIPISTPACNTLRRMPSNSTVKIMPGGIRCIPIKTLKSTLPPSSPNGTINVAQFQTISSHLPITREERKSSSVKGIDSILSYRRMQLPTASSPSSTTTNKIVALKRKVSDCGGSESDFIFIE